jgi:hypothetical protein
MTTIHDPLDLVCGATWSFAGRLRDACDKPLDLTGASISWRLDSLDGTENIVALSFESSGGISVIDLAQADILVTPSSEETIRVPPGIYRDWLWVTLADGTMFPEWTGIIRAAAAPA